MPRVVWTPVAESDLGDILFYIAFVDHKAATGERIYYETATGQMSRPRVSSPDRRTRTRQQVGFT